MRQAETQEINILTKKLDEACFIEFGTRVVQKKDGGAIYPVYGGGGATFKMDTYNRENCLVVSRFAMSKQCTRFVEGKFFLNDSGLTVRPRNEKELSQSYLVYLLLTLNDTIYLLSRGTAQRNLNVPKFRNLEISYPDSVELQLHIASILSKAENLIAKRKESIRLLDEFLKSTFLEMFGDPATNSKGWEQMTLKDVCHKIQDGTHFSPPITSEGIPYITAKHVRENIVDFWSNPWFISEESHREIYKRCNPVKGDVLYIKDGATTGYAAINPYDFEFSMLSSLALLKPKTGLTNSEYLCAWLNNPNAKRSILTKMAGGAIKRLTLTKINALQILIPPIELQTQFAQIVEKTEALKSQYQQSLQELENLYGSLSQRAFRGELSVKQLAKL